LKMSDSSESKISESTKRFHPLIYEEVIDPAKKKKVEDNIENLRKCIHGNPQAEVTLCKLAHDVHLDVEQDIDNLKVVYLKLQAERTIGLLYCGLSKNTLYDIQISKMLIFLVPISWFFAILGLFVSYPYCNISVCIFTILTTITVGIRFLAIDIEIESMLVKQFSHQYKLLQGILFGVSFGLICKFIPIFAVCFGIAHCLWLWFICSVDAFVMRRRDKVINSILIMLANLFLAVYLVTSHDMKERVLSIALLKWNFLKVSWATTCLNAVVQTILLSANATISLRFRKEASVNIIINAPLTHCMDMIYDADKGSKEVTESRDRQNELAVSFGQNVSKRADFTKDVGYHSGNSTSL